MTEKLKETNYLLIKIQINFKSIIKQLIMKLQTKLNKVFSHVSDANTSQHIGMPGLTGHLIISYVVKYIVTVCFVKL